MNNNIIDGKSIAAQLKEEIKNKVKQLDKKPGLAVILVGEDPASQVYVRNKIKATEDVGMISFERKMNEDSTKEDIEAVIKELNEDEKVDGILLQLPLPPHLSKVQEELVQMINPEKDVDGLTTVNAGKLFLGMDNGLVPCTPQGAMRLIKSVKQDITGLNAVVIGRSNLFGKPMAQLLLKENCTVTIAHSKTKDIAKICKQADILVAAVGRNKMVKKDWVKDDAIVIDVGINRVEIDGKSKLEGDVDFEEVKGKASAITPVPGGVGPMTIACLLDNTLKAYKG